MQYLAENVPQFVEPNNWPPNSPDLNVMDYFVWSAMDEMVYKGKTFSNVRDLKDAISEAWERLSQASINRAIGHWRERLNLCVRENGGHFEHKC